jgi:hypothetical protein
MQKINKDWSEIKLGHVVSSYHAGTWVVTEIEKRKDYTPLVYLTKIATRDGKPCKPQTKVCDITWCHIEPQNRLDYLIANGVKF